MLKDDIRIQQAPKEEDRVKIEEVNLNKLIITLPLEGFTIKADTPLFNIEGISPAEIALIGITASEFFIQMNTPEFDLVTTVPSLEFEVFNPEGIRITRIATPPE
ncbi:MAG: hypothetical protein ACOYVK_01650 [Bacillota bacterium]